MKHERMLQAFDNLTSQIDSMENEIGILGRFTNTLSGTPNNETDISSDKGESKAISLADFLNGTGVDIINRLSEKVNLCSEKLRNERSRLSDIFEEERPKEA